MLCDSATIRFAYGAAVGAISLFLGGTVVLALGPPTPAIVRDQLSLIPSSLLRRHGELSIETNFPYSLGDEWSSACPHSILPPLQALCLPLHNLMPCGTRDA